ncbi:hypothetical protein SEA_LILMARTIN_54 [Streptomyces phage LilMartin]|nr:hypothetical protein SEA_LILMARTIN_54 [Streptomyces phage LilMartin]QNO12478.1 tail assembly chaperone [Streptomyces phage MulchMansion]UVK61151.1 tail assembly chaperone [Streptomyces phage Angela]
MATSVYTVEEIVLQDGNEVTLKPLNIKGLRKFMKKFKELENLKDDDQVVDFLIEVGQLCLASLHPEYSDTDKYEDAVDMPTVHKIIEICGGVKLNDPELMAAAAAVMEQQAGTS